MNNKKYIKAIEELNKEYLDFTHSNIYLKNNRKRKLKRYLRTLSYQRLYLALKAALYNRFNKPLKKSIEIKNKPKVRKGKKVVYTCIVNNYDKLLEPIIRTPNTDYIVFSNESNIIHDDCWQGRKIDKAIIQKCSNNPTLINRYIKMHPHELFPEYDLALYIDGNVRVVSDIEECFSYINDKTGLAMHQHAKRSDVYEEAKACVKLKKGNKKNIKKLIKKYEKEKFPRNYGLYQASVITIDLKNPTAKNILDEWYEEFVKQNTKRDQLSLPYVLWKNNFNFSDVGILGNNIYQNSKFRIHEHNFSHNRFFEKLINLRRKILNFGFKHTCNVCHCKIKKWRPGGIKHQIFLDNHIIGAGYRQTFNCPVCGVKDKDRLIYFYLKKYTDILKKPCIILHFAPEKLIYKKIKKKCKINKNFKYYNGDLDPTHADMVIDITNIDFPDNKFDYIICNHVLEHVREEEKAFKELKRVIKPTGKIIFTVPVCISNAHTIEDDTITDPQERMSKFCQEDHVRLYGRDITERIKKYGLKVEEFKVNNRKVEEKYGLLKDGIIYILSKEN